MVRVASEHPVEAVPYSYSQFTETERDQVTCPGSRREPVTEPGIEPRSPESQFRAITIIKPFGVIVSGRLTMLH